MNYQDRHNLGIVARRVGGLEIDRCCVLQSFDVARRVGGLEKYAVQWRAQCRVARRVGGLENQTI